MKRIIITLIICLFTATGIYAGLADGKPDAGKGTSGSLLKNTEIKSNNESQGGFFRSGDLDERPDIGGGIGQETPINDGMCVLSVCCLLMGAWKFARSNFLQKASRKE